MKLSGVRKKMRVNMVDSPGSWGKPVREKFECRCFFGAQRAKHFCVVFCTNTLLIGAASLRDKHTMRLARVMQKRKPVPVPCIMRFSDSRERIVP
jgi:hypothetical protein